MRWPRRRSRPRRGPAGLGRACIFDGVGGSLWWGGLPGGRGGFNVALSDAAHPSEHGIDAPDLVFESGQLLGQGCGQPVPAGGISWDGADVGELPLPSRAPPVVSLGKGLVDGGIEAGGPIRNLGQAACVCRVQHLAQPALCPLRTRRRIAVTDDP